MSVSGAVDDAVDTWFRAIVEQQPSLALQIEEKHRANPCLPLIGSAAPAAGFP
jgi:hypothetical protein